MQERDRCEAVKALAHAIGCIMGKTDDEAADSVGWAAIALIGDMDASRARELMDAAMGASVGSCGPAGECET